MALAMRGAHAALIGPRPGPRHPAAKVLEAARAQAAAGGARAAEGEVQVDKWTGEVLHDPATDRPLLSARLHSRASRLRGYRIAHRAGRTAYAATLGLPRTVHTAKGKASEFTEDARTQLLVSRNRIREDAAGWQPVVDGTVKAGRAVGQGAVTTGRAVRDTAISVAVYTAPATAGRAPGPRSTISRPDHPTAATLSPAPAAGRSTVRRPVPAPATGSGCSATSRGAGSTNRGSGAAPAAPAADQASANVARLRAAMNRRRQSVRRDQEGGAP